MIFIYQMLELRGILELILTAQDAALQDSNLIALLIISTGPDFIWLQLFIWFKLNLSTQRSLKAQFRLQFLSILENLQGIHKSRKVRNYPVFQIHLHLKIWKSNLLKENLKKNKITRKLLRTILRDWLTFLAPQILDIK